MGLGGVSLIDVSEEAGVLSIGITVDGADSRNVWVELAPLLIARVRVHHEVERLLNRPARISSLLVDVPTGIFGKSGVRLSGRRNGDQRERQGISTKLTIIAAKLYAR